MGREHWDACVGTWGLGNEWGGTQGRRDLGTYETRVRVGRGRGDARTSNIGDAGGKVRGKCDISFLVKMCYL